MTTSRRRPARAEDEPASVSRGRAQAVADKIVSPPPQVEREAVVDDAPPVTTKTPIYPRLLRLRHVHPNAWQRAVLGEGAVGVGVLLSMADLATAWSIVALPVAVAVVVKAHDALQGLLDRGAAPEA